MQPTHEELSNLRVFHSI